jgi:hypothetical protein
MALDYRQSAQLRTNLIFQGRIASSALKWADSIFASNSVDLTQPQKPQEIFFARDVFMNPNQKAATLQPAVVQDPAVQAQDLDPETGDSMITDAYLQAAVEAAIRKVI